MVSVWMSFRITPASAMFCPFPVDATEDDTGLCRRNLDGGFDALEAVRGKGIHRRALDNLEVP
jgi:hypothetical protein